MNEQLLLVDLENIHRFDLGKAPPNARIKIFVGQMQSKLPTALVQQAQALGSRLQWVTIDGNGPNALDFHIACHLGEGICKYPKAEFVILSNDRGLRSPRAAPRGARVQVPARRPGACDACAPRAAPGARAGGGGPHRAQLSRHALQQEVDRGGGQEGDRAPAGGGADRGDGGGGDV